MFSFLSVQILILFLILFSVNQNLLTYFLQSYPTQDEISKYNVRNLCKTNTYSRNSCCPNNSRNTVIYVGYRDVKQNIINQDHDGKMNYKE